jgi:2,3-bisphosphoglycerate-independent phosphoglycerate mutase
MKGILVILDGVGDLPHKQLGDKTPLEAAQTPNLDFLAARGELGELYPVRPGFVPESDEAIISIFGNELISSTRGQLEARSTDVKLARGDLAFRVNFATIDSPQKGNIVDRRAGRTLTTAEAEILAKAINNQIKMPCKFEFIPTIQHRGVLILRGGFSDNILGNDSTYIQGKSHNTCKVCFSKPLDEEENSQYTANVVNEFLNQIFDVLDSHPVNIERKKKGLLPANYLLMRGAGVESPKLKIYRKWLSPSYMPLEIGFSKISGMKTLAFEYPALKNLDAYANLWDGLKKACDFAKTVIKKEYNNYDYTYVHFKETDNPGHDNKPVEKKLMIEYIDKTFFKFLKDFVTQKKIKVVVTGDHSTPCKLKDHSADPVPILFYNDSIPKEKRFCEKEAQSGSLGKIVGKDLFEIVGFDK